MQFFDQSGISYDAKLEGMVEKGNLRLEDREQAETILQEVSPFHLENYGLVFRQKNGQYQDGTTFAQIYEMYHADRTMKNFLFDYLADFEVQLRNVTGYVLGERFGTYGYLDPDHFQSEEYHKNFLNDFENELKWANEPFVQRYLRDGEPERVPVYVALEVITLGTLSKLVANLHRQEKKQIARLFRVKSEEVMLSFFQGMTNLRNTCAHHGRLMHRRFKDGCAILKEDRRTMAEYAPGFQPDPQRLFIMVLALIHLLDSARGEEVIAHFSDLFAEHPHFAPAFIDFPDQWKEILSRPARLGQGYEKRQA